MKRNNWFRFLLAMVVAPLVPILTLASVYWLETGSRAWFGVFLLFGYLFFLVLGLPIAGVLISKRTILSCAIGGGVTSIAPVLLLSVFSIFSGNKIFTLETVGSLALLFVVGSIGGAVFWLLAFAPGRRSAVD
jgi:hypothetical protein